MSFAGKIVYYLFINLRGFSAELAAVHTSACRLIHLHSPSLSYTE